MDNNKIAERLIKKHKDFKAEGFSEYMNGLFNGIMLGLEYEQKKNQNKKSNKKTPRKRDYKYDPNAMSFFKSWDDVIKKMKI